MRPKGAAPEGLLAGTSGGQSNEGDAQIILLQRLGPPARRLRAAAAELKEVRP